MSLGKNNIKINNRISIKTVLIEKAPFYVMTTDTYSRTYLVRNCHSYQDIARGMKKAFLEMTTQLVPESLKNINANFVIADGRLKGHLLPKTRCKKIK